MVVYEILECLVDIKITTEYVDQVARSRHLNLLKIFVENNIYPTSEY